MKIQVRPYFSFSQFNSFRYSKAKFLKSYYYGQREESCYMDLGKRLGTAIQFREKKETKLIDKIRQQIPEQDIYEYEIRAELGKINLLCYLDGFSKKDFSVMELKTGKSPSEKSWREQQLFYATALYLNHKKLPSKITLYWCKTEFNSKNKLVLTGDCKSYNIVITLPDVIKFSAEIIKTYKEIQTLCENEYEMFGTLPVSAKKDEKLYCKKCKIEIFSQKTHICMMKNLKQQRH